MQLFHLRLKQAMNQPLTKKAVSAPVQLAHALVHVSHVLVHVQVEEVVK